MAFLRYIDLALVIFFAPLAIVAGAPALGYALGAGSWIIARASGVLVERKAKEADPRTGIGLQVAGMMGRAWVVGLAVVAAGVIGDKDDAICAAVVALVAFTVYLPMSLIVRQMERNTVRP